MRLPKAAIDGIRGAGARQLILAPGNGFTGGHSWTQVTNGNLPSSQFMNKMIDPLFNTAIDIHEVSYLDIHFYVLAEFRCTTTRSILVREPGSA